MQRMIVVNPNVPHLTHVMKVMEHVQMILAVTTVSFSSVAPPIVSLVVSSLKMCTTEMFSCLIQL